MGVVWGQEYNYTYQEVTDLCVSAGGNDLYTSAMSRAHEWLKPLFKNRSLCDLRSGQALMPNRVQPLC